MLRRYIFSILSVALIIMIGAVNIEAATVVTKGENTFIKDMHGELWDVTQAKSLGFSPGKFQYGIGRNAFRPLDSSALTKDTSGIRRGTRVIGVSDGKESQAYSVPRLRHHEIANTVLGEIPITVGY